MRMKEGWCISLESGSLGPWYYHFLFHLHFVLFRFGVSFFFLGGFWRGEKMSMAPCYHIS